MITPNGRFEVNVKICLSISDFHPNTWNPTWNLSTILIGLLSFMMENRPTFGAIMSTDGYKRKLAKQSLEANLNNSTFVELFPDIVEEIKEELENRRKLCSTSSTTTKTKSNSNNANNSNRNNNNDTNRKSNIDGGDSDTLHTGVDHVNSLPSNTATTTINSTTNNSTTFNSTAAASSSSTTAVNQSTRSTIDNQSTGFWSMVYNLIAVFLLIGIGCAVRFFLS